MKFCHCAAGFLDLFIFVRVVCVSYKTSCLLLSMSKKWRFKDKHTLCKLLNEPLNLIAAQVPNRTEAAAAYFALNGAVAGDGQDLGLPKTNII
jgi:hypothetical protein